MFMCFQNTKEYFIYIYIYLNKIYTFTYMKRYNDLNFTTVHSTKCKSQKYSLMHAVKRNYDTSTQ